MALPLPPEPETSAVLMALQGHKQLLLAQDAETVFQMTTRWIQLENTLEARLVYWLGKLPKCERWGKRSVSIDC